MKRQEIEKRIAMLFSNDMQASKQAGAELLTEFLVAIHEINASLKPRVDVGLAPRADESTS